jgi:glutathione-specific gamma-glutamylcyclotransferase
MLELERTVTMQTARLMSLTPEMVKLCHRDVVDPGPSPDTKYLRDEDFRPAAEQLVSLKMPGPFWLFAYGSLIWKPEIPSIETKRATAHGWHRAFSMKIERYRGTKEQPGYMMCLDRNGSCEGVVLRLPDEDLGGQVEKLLRREISRKGGLDAVRWIDVETVDGTSQALAFYAAPDTLEYYQSNRAIAEIAHGLARACGHWGSGADYLYNTVSHLEQLGIHDEGLWQLQELVAAEIKTLYGIKH